MLKGLCHVQDRLEEAETRENQSREEGEKAKADLFQVGHHLSTLYSILNIRLKCSWYPIFKIKSSIVLYKNSGDVFSYHSPFYILKGK